MDTPNDVLPADAGLSIRCRPRRVTRSLETVQAVTADGSPPTDHGRRIGVRPDGTAAGCVVMLPVGTFDRKASAAAGPPPAADRAADPPRATT